MSSDTASGSIRPARRAPLDGSHRDRVLPAFLVAMIALGAGLLDPTLSVSQRVHRQLLVFDITQSMNVVDEPVGVDPPTRLDLARRSALAAMAGMRCGSEVGLGLFTGHRTLVLFAPVEVCEHYGDIAATVKAIDWRMAWEARSEVAKGLHSSLLAARTLGRDISVVFVTDGHEAPPLNASLLPRFRGTVGETRGVVAGVGGDKAMPIPKLDASGRRRGFWRPEDVMQVDPFSLGRVGSSVRGEALAGVDQSALQSRIAAGTEHLSSLKEDYLRQLAAGLALHYETVRSSADMRRLLEHPALALRRPAGFSLRHPLAAIALALVLAAYLEGIRPSAGGPTQRSIGAPLPSTRGTP